MSQIKSGNSTHDANCAAADAARQVVLTTPGVSQAQAKAADLALYRACRASAITNGCGISQFTAALQELGQGGQ